MIVFKKYTQQKFLSFSNHTVNQYYIIYQYYNLSNIN